MAPERGLVRIGILGPLDVRDAAARPVEVAGRRLRALGCLAEEGGDLEAAERWHVRAFTSWQEDALMGNPTMAYLVEGLAAYVAARGAPVRAAELLGTAHTLNGYRDTFCHEVHRTLPAVIGALGEDAFTAAYDRGRQATREDVLKQGADLVVSV